MCIRDSAGCVGLVTLAYWDAADIDSYLETKLESFTDSTVVDPGIIRSRLGAIRRGELLWTHGEYVDGISSVAAPILNELGQPVAALYAYGPSYRFPERATSAGPGGRAVGIAVGERAADVSRDLGWTEPSADSSIASKGAA